MHTLSFSLTHSLSFSHTLCLFLSHTLSLSLTHTLSFSLTQSLSFSHTLSLFLSHTLPLSLTHSLSFLSHTLSFFSHTLSLFFSHTLSLSLTLSLSFSLTLSLSLTHSLFHTHTLSVLTHTHTPTRSHTHPPTHTHTHTPEQSIQAPWQIAAIGAWRAFNSTITCIYWDTHYQFSIKSLLSIHLLMWHRARNVNWDTHYHYALGYPLSVFNKNSDEHSIPLPLSLVCIGTPNMSFVRSMHSLMWHAYIHMGWLRLVGFLKLHVSFAKEPYKTDDIRQKRPKIFRSLLIVATP